MIKSREVISNILLDERIVYGINTGFGNFSNVIIPPAEMKQLQLNLIISHSAGTGKPISLEYTRMLLALRINILCKGHSGISIENLEKYVEAFNRDILPLVPEQGTVGASGDLAPLSHLAAGLLGYGKIYKPQVVLQAS